MVAGTCILIAGLQQEAEWQAETAAAVRAAEVATEAECLARHMEWRLRDARAAEEKLAKALEARRQT